MSNTSPSKSLIALAPFLVFLGLFLGTGWILTLQGVEYAFYQLPASIAIIPAVIFSMVLGFYLSKSPIEKQISQFISGAGHANIITMCFIYLLAGAFAVVAKATGSVDASVQLGLTLFPSYLLLPGLFIVAAFISTAMGTSMGTIAAIAPVALGFINSANLEPGLVAGCIISGAIFGDNLSIISDTTIAATRSQGAEMKDKFKVNFKFVMPAALLCLVILTLMGNDIVYKLDNSNIQIAGLIPYIAILILALMGVNVFLVLMVGIILAAVIGIFTSGYQLSSWIQDITTGFTNMQDIFILSLLIGGLSELVRQQGGLAALISLIKRIASKITSNNKRSAGYSIAGLVFICNFFTANNTVSIIVTGDTAKDIAQDGNLLPAESASLLDIFSCINQGLLPYGAQVLLLASTIGISPLTVVSYSYYPMVLFFIAGYFFWRLSSYKKVNEA